MQSPASGKDTPLHWAAYHGNQHVLSMLLDAGADLVRTSPCLADVARPEGVNNSWLAIIQRLLTSVSRSGLHNRYFTWNVVIGVSRRAW